MARWTIKNWFCLAQKQQMSTLHEEPWTPRRLVHFWNLQPGRLSFGVPIQSQFETAELIVWTEPIHILVVWLRDCTLSVLETMEKFPIQVSTLDGQFKNIWPNNLRWSLWTGSMSGGTRIAINITRVHRLWRVIIHEQSLQVGWFRMGRKQHSFPLCIICETKPRAVNIYR